jgi:DNA-binding HxlR family transcriptional regulator
MGRSLFDVVACMVGWEQRHAGNNHGTVVQITHRACTAGTIAPELICLHCGTPVYARDVTVLPAPSAKIRELPLKKASYRRAATSRGVGSAHLPLPQCMEIVGDKWTIEILVIIFMRVGSFVDMQKFSGISSNVLSDRLTRLLKLGVLRQTTTTEAGRAGSYRITDKGAAFYPILLALQAWADDWLPDRLRSPLALTHRPCGRPLKLAVACSACGDSMTAESCDVSIED